MKDVRARFTANPHGLSLEDARTALYNWLLARRYGGRFSLVLPAGALPVESPDPGSLLAWLGLDWDDGPALRAERLPGYRARVQDLLDSGEAYPCYCSDEELAAMRSQQLAHGLDPRYGRRCLGLYAEDRADLEAQGRKPSVRLKVPDGRVLRLPDAILGTIEMPTDPLGDVLLMDREGMVSEALAGALEDAEFAVTHAVRGEARRSLTFQQVLVAEALGLPLPSFCHYPSLPAIASHALADFRAAGGSPDLLLRWFAPSLLPVPGESLREVARRFSLEDLGMPLAATAMPDPGRPDSPAT